MNCTMKHYYLCTPQSSTLCIDPKGRQSKASFRERLLSHSYSLITFQAIPEAPDVRALTHKWGLPLISNSRRWWCALVRKYEYTFLSVSSCFDEALALIVSQAMKLRPIGLIDKLTRLSDRHTYTCSILEIQKININN